MNNYTTPLIKAILGFTFIGIAMGPLQAQPRTIAPDGYMLPKSSFREVLEIVVGITNKPVVVSSEDELRIQTSLVIPGPVAYENVRKVIGALLLLEGYELVDEGKELHLKRILTKEQCQELNAALGRNRPKELEPPLRQRVQGPDQPGDPPRIIVRPDKP